MLIDWFTVGAQALNFLILVWLMRRFLYKPILGAIDAREKQVASEVADAAAKQAEAQKERDEFQKKNQDFEQQREALMTKAQDDAKTERHKLLDAARKEADAQRDKGQDALRSEYQSLSDSITNRMRQEVFSIARKTLGDLASATLEQQMVEVFVARLAAMSDAQKADLKKSLRDGALFRSAFDLPPAQQNAVEKAIEHTLAISPKIQFETKPDLLNGIELSGGGWKLAWSVSDYISSLEAGVGDLLKTPPKPEPVAK